jgi:hypothetical protein
VPYKHRFWVDGCEIAQSVDYSQNEKTADLQIYSSELNEIVPVAEAADFTGVQNSIEWSGGNWMMPSEDFLFVAFAQRDASHEIDDDFTLTQKYYPRYRFRNTD